MVKPTEHKIINGCKAQDPLFQKELVLRYSGLLLTVSRRYTHDLELAKDVLQEGLVKVLKSIDQYEPTGSFEAWMKRIIINTALAKRQKKSFSFEISGFEDLPEKEIAPDVYSHLQAEDLIELINRLPEGFRLVFNMYAIEGYSHKEIGDLLGITESSSRSQLSRARKMLKTRLLQQEKISI